MDLTKLSEQEREAYLRAEQKSELTKLVLHYFSTFGWNTKTENDQILVQKILPGEPWRVLLVINAPYENYPSTKELKKMLKTSSLVVVSSEYSPRLKKSKIVSEQHTASGLNFSYLQKLSDK